MEPTQSDKYLLRGLILCEERENLPLVRFNGDKCRFTLISMNNAMIKDVDGKLQKDKSSERKSSGVLPRKQPIFLTLPTRLGGRNLEVGLKIKLEVLFR